MILNQRVVGYVFFSSKNLPLLIYTEINRVDNDMMMCTLKPAFIEHFTYEKHTSYCQFPDDIAGQRQSQDFNVFSDRGPQCFCWVSFVGSSDFIFIKEEGYLHKQVCVCVLCVYVCNVIKNTCFQCTLCHLHVATTQYVLLFKLMAIFKVLISDYAGRSNFLLTKIRRGINRSILNKTRQNASQYQKHYDRKENSGYNYVNTILVKNHSQ